MHDQRRRGDSSEFAVRAQVEDLVEQRPAEPERRRVLQVPVFRQTPPRLLVDLVVVPVGLLVDEPVLVVQERIEKHQAADLLGMAGSEQRGYPAAETGTHQHHRIRTDRARGMRGSGPDVAEYPGDREVLHPPLALAVRPEVEPERRDAGLGQAVREAGEEATLLAAHTPAMHQHRDPQRGARRSQQAPRQQQPVRTAERHGLFKISGHVTP